MAPTKADYNQYEDLYWSHLWFGAIGEISGAVNVAHGSSDLRYMCLIVCICSKIWIDLGVYTMFLEIGYNPSTASSH